MSDLDLHFTLPEHANISIIPMHFDEGEPCTQDIVIDGLSLDDLIHLRDVVQERINGYRIRITRTIL